MNVYEVELPAQFGSLRQLDRLSGDAINYRRRKPVHVDLHEVTFIRPLAVVGIVQFLETMIRRGRPVRVSFPSHPRILNYLVAIGLPDMMNRLGTWAWPEGFPIEAPQGLRPVIRLTSFAGSEEVETISQQMQDVFTNDSILPVSLSAPCYQVFAELADNVVNHAKSSGYVLAQRYEYKEGPVIDIAIGDCGIGVRRSLFQNRMLRPKLTDDSAALRLAMKDGVTRVPDEYRGYGLGYVRSELSSPGRKLVVRSGTAIAVWHEGRPVRVYDCKAFVGTLAHAIIPC